MNTVKESEKILNNSDRKQIDFCEKMGMLKNPNNFDYWFEKIKDITEFEIPKTKIIKFAPVIVAMMYNSDVSDKQIELLDGLIKKELKESGFNYNDLFIKTGTYSGKYDFRDCHCKITDNLFERFYRISYDAAMVGAGVPPTMILREFIPSDESTPKIYRGMPLRSEYRVFVDFDNEKIMGIVDYWNENEMCKLANGENLEEAKFRTKSYTPYKKYEKERFEYFSTWLEWYENLDEETVENQKKYILEKIDPLVKSHTLNGRWSVDIMIENNKYYLIDMAIAEQSAMYELVSK